MKNKTKTSRTLNPKPLTGNENMNETLTKNLMNHVDFVITSAHRQGRIEAADIIWEKSQQIETILDSQEARHILGNCYGEKFDKMINLRRALRSKNQMLIELWAKILQNPA